MSGTSDLSRLPARALWSDDAPLECVSVIPEALNTATFTFQAPDGALFDYLPGQFVTLELPLPGGAVHRTYTISSSPSRPRSLSVTVKAQADSTGTRWMLDHLRPGMRLKASGPAGVFSHLNHPSEKYLFISAGSGITPLMAMTTFMFDLGTVPDIVFVGCARRPAEVIFRERLEHMASRVPGIDLHWVVSHADPFRPWTGYRGRFNQLMLGLMAPDYLERRVFCCGPEPFMQTVREGLQGLGFPMDHYHQESYHAPAATAAEVPPLDDVVPEEGRLAELTFAASGVTAQVAQTDTVLAAARASGLNIPSGCTFGVCGTCKVKKLWGAVHMVHNGGISEDDIAEGYILACCAHPIGKVAVEV